MLINVGSIEYDMDIKFYLKSIIKSKIFIIK